jgi:small subunit ribosomal protein S20
MANIKQQKKRIGQDAKRRLRNLSVKTRMKTMVKKADAALTADPANAKPAVNEALSAIDKAASKGVIHPNSAARKKSSLMHREDKASASA